MMIWSVLARRQNHMLTTRQSGTSARTDYLTLEQGLAHGEAAPAHGDVYVPSSPE